jgi:hypothetical protein
MQEEENEKTYEKQTRVLHNAKSRPRPTAQYLGRGLKQWGMQSNVYGRPCRGSNLDGHSTLATNHTTSSSW